MEKNEIQKYRDNIDKIDEQILKLFVDRLKNVEKIFEIKKKTGKAILDNNREKSILNKIENNIVDDKYIDEGVKLFNSIMSISKEMQQRLKEEENE